MKTVHLKIIIEQQKFRPERIFFVTAGVAEESKCLGETE